MRKIACLVSLVVVSSALAGGITQMEDFTANIGNAVNLLHGTQSASSSNLLTVLNNQSAGTPCLTFAKQEQIGFFSQVGSADGMCALIGLEQQITGAGVQMQSIGEGVGPKLQGQELALLATQGVAKADGAGTATADQVMSISQDQNAMNAAGPANESSVVFGVQNAMISGAPGATGMAGGSIGVSTSQTQTVN